MKVFHYETIPAEPAEGLPGVAIRWAIGRNVSAPNFVTRIIEVQPGCATAYHQHPWEHEVVVLDGSARLRDAQGEQVAGPGACVYVAPDEWHQFANAGEGVLRIVCVIPYPPAS